MLKEEVEFKHLKKMKKRRQLDALVDSIKLPRGRKNSASALELLDEHSESSDGDDYSHPPVGSSKKKFCICEGILSRVSLLMISVASISICVGLIWVQWHVCHELALMREQVATVTKYDDATPEAISNIHKNLAVLNRSMTEIKTSSVELKANFDGIKKKIEALENTKAVLDQKLEKATEMLDLPTKFTALEKTVAEMGSDVQQERAQLVALEKQMNEQKDRASEAPLAAATPAPHPDAEQQSGLVSLVQLTSNMKEDMRVMNQSLRQDMVTLKQQIENQEMALTAFAQVHTSDMDLSSGSMEKMITDAVSQITKNISIFGAGGEDDPMGMGAIMQEIQELVSTSSQFLLFKDEIVTDMKHVNSTLIQFSAEFEEIHSRLTLVDGALTNLTSVMKKNHLPESQGADEDTATGPASTTSTTSPSSTNSSSAPSSTANTATTAKPLETSQTPTEPLTEGDGGEMETSEGGTNIEEPNTEGAGGSENPDTGAEAAIGTDSEPQNQETPAATDSMPGGRVRSKRSDW